ncbi:BTAD domain-containing putative transcriptional regulator [Kitasatospora sp. NPDC058218]|uniref:AfsR/SARP family transcriptional regulator n=1 Tax=Kitasatospora sp. NPDC058218 TaxID=3346385 RepID=UPI0036DBBE6E
MLQYRILGPLEATRGHHPCTPTAPRALATLALLVVRANHVVSLDTIIKELWNDQPPRSGATTAQTYVYQLRRLIDEAAGGTGKDVLVTKAPGYSLLAAPDEIDVFRFERLTAGAHTLMEANRPDLASVKLREALDLWSGPPLANVEVGPVLEGYVAALEEQRIHALNLRIEADLRLGRHHQMVAELRSLIVEHPYNEWYHSLLVFTLARVGRRHDALEAYARTHRVLSEDLGLAPCSELRRIQQDVLLGRQIEPPRSMTLSIEPRSA